jgi:sarcosine oxidase subunit gamma
MLKSSHAARRIMALAGIATTSARTTDAPGMMIRPAPARARFSLRLDPALARPGVAGFDLALPINGRSRAGERSALRLGPDEWLLIGPDGDSDVIPGQVEAALEGGFHALTDVSHRNVAIIVAGRHAAAILNSGCPLDLSEAAFPTGRATRTLLGKAEILLSRVDDAPTFEVECWRSFATYVHDFLVEAAREYEG